MENLIRKLIEDRIYSNTFWLIASSIVLNFFGFIFWTINTRLFSSEQIGLASTLIASAQLIIMISFLGLDISLIKYVPNQKNKKNIISSCFTISGIVAILASLIFVLGIDIFSPELGILKNKLVAISFILFVVFYLFFFLIDDLFIALRKPRIIFLKSSVFSILKLIFPFALISIGAYGIFSSWMISSIISFFLGLFFLKYKPIFKIHKQIIKKILKFSLVNYVSNFLRNAPGMLFPLMITNLISPVKTAYFYISWMIASLLFIVPISISKTLLSESSRKENQLKRNIKKSFLFIFVLIIPSVLFIFFASKYILLLFGKEYSENGFRLLQILSLSSIPFAINVIYSTIKNIQNKLNTVLILNFLMALGSLVLGYLFISQGIIMMGISWLLTQSIISVYSLIKIAGIKNE